MIWTPDTSNTLVRTNNILASNHPISLTRSFNKQHNFLHHLVLLEVSDAYRSFLAVYVGAANDRMFVGAR